MFGTWPLGRIFLRRKSGFCETENISPPYESQSAFLRLVKVRWGASGKFISNELPVGQELAGGGSELRVVRNS